MLSWGCLERKVTNQFIERCPPGWPALQVSGSYTAARLATQNVKVEEVRYFDTIMHLAHVIDAQQFGAAEKGRRHIKRFGPMRDNEINCHQ